MKSSKKLKKWSQALTIGFISLISCNQPSPRDLLVIDWEETGVSGVKTNLNIKVLSAIDKGEITASDSLEIIYNKINAEAIDDLEFDSLVLFYKNKIELVKGFIEDYEGKIAAAKTTKDLNVDIYENAVINFNKTLQSHEKKLADLLRYSGRGDEVLVKKVEYTFKMNNPLLNNVEQQITKIYLFTPDESAIVGTL